MHVCYDFFNRRNKCCKKSVWRKKTVLGFPSTNMQWRSLFKHQTKVSLLFSFRSLSWRTGEYLHVFHLFHVFHVFHVTLVFQFFSMFFNPGLQDLMSSAALTRPKNYQCQIFNKVCIWSFVNP